MVVLYCFLDYIFLFGKQGKYRLEYKRLKRNGKSISISLLYVFCFTMNTEERIFIKRNLVKLIIGLILLGFSFSYIQKHPAEKASIFSGFQVLRQRVVVYVHKITDTNSEAYKKKYDYEKTYQELINMAESKDCVDPNIITELNETYLSLKKEWMKTLEENLPGYVRKANEYKHMVDSCTK